MKKLYWFLLCAALSAAHAQKNEFAVMASTFQTSASFNVHGGQGLQLDYARRIVHIPLASLYLEIPFGRDGAAAVPSPRGTCCTRTTTPCTSRRG
jgi:hypothetical protein